MEIFVLGATFDWGLVGPFFSLGNFVYRKSLIFVFGANYFVKGHCKTYVDHVRVSLLTRVTARVSCSPELVLYMECTLGDDMLAARCLMLNSYLIDRYLLFLHKFDDQYRRRQVVDQCSLWKEVFGLYSHRQKQE